MNTMIKTRSRTLGFIIAILFLSGCASQSYNTKVLKEPNRFAIVSVSGITTGFGMSAEEETKLLTSAEKLIYKELKQSKYFKLVPPSKVKKSRSYRSIKGESTSGIFTMQMAKGYKKFDMDNEKEAIDKLMKELKLTGVIHIMASFSKEDSGLSLSGFLPIPIPISAGTTSGKITFVLAVMDKNNQVIWQDMIEMETKDSVGNVMGVANLSKLYPQLLDITQQSANTTVENLNKNLL